MSRAALSEASGVASRTLYALEAGESANFGLGNLIRVLDVLGLALCIDDGTPVEASWQTATGSIDRQSLATPWDELPDVWRLDEDDAS